jgi:hypothetical protein
MSRHFIADAHRDDEKRFIVRADEKLTAFLELELAVRAIPFNGDSVALIIAKTLSPFLEVHSLD